MPKAWLHHSRIEGALMAPENERIQFTTLNGQAPASLPELTHERVNTRFLCESGDTYRTISDTIMFVSCSSRYYGALPQSGFQLAAWRRGYHLRWWVRTWWYTSLIICYPMGEVGYRPCSPTTGEVERRHSGGVGSIDELHRQAQRRHRWVSW